VRLFTVSNFITLSNLLCGCLGIMTVLVDGDLKRGGLLIAIALILDFFDGFAARLFNEASELGKQLDSLADVVSFGVLPGFILFKLIAGSAFFAENTEYAAFAIPLFSALRLAKFNIDTRQAYGFIGLPTPANAVAIGIFPFLLEDSLAISELITQSWFLIVYIAVFSYLLVSELPLPALKFKSYGWAKNKFAYTFLAIALVLLLILKLVAVPVIIYGYILYAIVIFFMKKV
jgi:CDP-diacylglycerol--serine O-phosphatidyltransferase